MPFANAFWERFPGIKPDPSGKVVAIARPIPMSVLRKTRRAVLGAAVLSWLGIVFAGSYTGELTTRTAEWMFARYLYWLWLGILAALGCSRRYWRVECGHAGWPAWRLGLLLSVLVLAGDVLWDFALWEIVLHREPGQFFGRLLPVAAAAASLSLLVGLIRTQGRPQGES